MARSKARSGVCPICQQTAKSLSGDHCHESGAHRDFICPNCNTGLGMFRDSSDVLVRAAVYLEKHKALQALTALSDDEEMLLFEYRMGRFDPFGSLTPNKGRDCERALERVPSRPRL